jgi:sigma-B regulation protein RsbU (phosphoserine phosphatase)
MRVAPQAPIAAGEAELALPTLDGARALMLRWQPDQPGREMLAAVMPWLGVTALGLGLFVALVIRHASRAADAIAASATQLAQANAEISALNDKLTDENLRLGAELDVARRIQVMVLPKEKELQRIPTLDIASYIIPAEDVAGDYYDVLQDGTKTKIGIGDVTGHGLESGVLMLMVQSVARALQETGENNPKQFLNVLNRAIYKNIERTATDKHLSLAFVDYEDDRLTLSGQHEEALIIRGDGTIERIDTMELGFPVGLEPDISDFVATRDLVFSGDDVMVLYTDGVTEAESPTGEHFGIERLCYSAQKYRSGTSEQIKDGIISDLMQHIGTQKIHDDITLVALRHR